MNRKTEEFLESYFQKKLGKSLNEVRYTPIGEIDKELNRILENPSRKFKLNVDKVPFVCTRSAFKIREAGNPGEGLDTALEDDYGFYESIRNFTKQYLDPRNFIKKLYKK